MRPLRQILTTAGSVLALAVVVSLYVPQSPLRAVIVAGTSMEPTFESGDIAVTWRRDEYRAGEVIAFRIRAGEPGAGNMVIHRVVGGAAETGYVLRGDNRESNDLWHPRPTDVLGTAVLRVPKLGLLPGLLRTPLGIALACALFTISLLLGDRRPATVQARPVAATTNVSLSPVAAPSVRSLALLIPLAGLVAVWRGSTPASGRR